jgi:hypothetical protein
MSNFCHPPALLGTRPSLRSAYLVALLKSGSLEKIFLLLREEEVVLQK